MNRTHQTLLGLLFVGCFGCRNGGEEAAGPLPVEPLTDLVVEKVAEDLSKPDPDAAFWGKVRAGWVTLTAQPFITPRPEATTTDRVTVQAAHDGKHIALRLRWKDSEISQAGRLGEFSDAIAMQFPLKGGAEPPSVMMGAAGNPVHIFHWRAQYQRDAIEGKPEMTALYPNAQVDMYPMDFKDAKGGTQEQKEKFSPGMAVGNPQSYPKNGVDEIVAEGFSTSAVQEGHGSAGLGVWRDGEWTVVLVRSLTPEGGSNLAPGTKSHVGFAVWQGGKAEVGSRKSVTMQWTPVTVQ